MSRSGYLDDLDDPWQLIRWRGAVASAIRGKRGQDLLRSLLAALDALPERRLIAHDLIAPDGAVCALGAAGRARGQCSQMVAVDPEDTEAVAKLFGVAEALSREIAYWNDEGGTYRETPEQRFNRMRAWVAEQIRDTP